MREMTQHMLVDHDGRFRGYASMFNVVDQGGDVVMPSAFASSLRRKGAGGVRLLFQHDPKEPVGTWERIVEDDRGLWVEGRLQAGVPRADGLRRLIAGNAVDGLSIGFRSKRATKDARSGHRRLWQVELWEISIVTFPMMDGARIYPGHRLPGTDIRLARSFEAAISTLRN